MLQKQTVVVPLYGGADTKSDPKAVEIGSNIVVENFRFKKPNALTVRYGSDELSRATQDGGEIESGSKIASFKDELLLFSEDKAYSYIESRDFWTNKGEISNLVVSSDQIIRNTASQSVPDIGTTGGITAYAWEDTRGGIRASVVDNTTGSPLLSDISLSTTGTRPKIGVLDQYIFVYYMDSSNTLKVRRIDSSAPSSFSSELTVAGDVNGTDANYDVCFKVDGSGIAYGVIAYNTNASSIGVGYVTTTGAFGGPLQGLPTQITFASTGGSSIAVLLDSPGSGDIMVSYHNTTDGLVWRRFQIVAGALSNVATVTLDSSTTVVNNIGMIMADDDGGSSTLCRVFWEVSSAQTYNTRIKYNSVERGTGTLGTAGGYDFIRSLGLVSKPFMAEDGNTYFVAVHESNLQPTHFTIRFLGTGRGFVCNSIARGSSSGLTKKRSSLAHVSDFGSGIFRCPTVIKTRLNSDGAALYYLTGIQSTKITFQDEDIYQHKEIGGNLLISGGSLFSYDGKGVVEHGFNLYPENISNSITGAAGSIEAGTRLYVAVYEWVDNNGEIHQSSPSEPLSVTNSLNDRNTVTIPTLRITEKKASNDRTEVSIALYRTKDNGTVFYRVSSLTSPTLNTVNSDSVTIQDGLADTAIGSLELLYTTGGVLENIQSDSASLVDEYRNRIVLGGLEDKNSVQYSKQKELNVAVEFSDAFKFRTDQGRGGLTGIRAMDDKLILFKGSSIYVQIGQGPTVTGQNDDFQTPQLITSDVGCEEPQSIVSMPLGIMFKSAKGYYLLDRSLQTQYLGAPVEEFNDLTVTGAVLVENLNEVRFIHSSGSCVFYDYYAQRWGTYTNFSGVSATNWQSRFVLLKSDGTVRVESTETFLDAGSPIIAQVVTPWISLAGLQGAQRIYLAQILGDLKSKHQCVVEVEYNFYPAPTDQFVFDSETILGDQVYGDDAYYGEDEFYGGADSQLQYEINPSRHKCESIRFRIKLLNPDAVDGEMASLLSLSLNVGIKPGLARISHEKRVGPT